MKRKFLMLLIALISFKTYSSASSVEVKKAMNDSFSRSEKLTKGISKSVDEKRLIAQWLNWPNWPNWGNWGNWPNWRNF